MKISFKHRFVMFDIPKSASTSINAALARFSECHIDGHGVVKHMLVSDYEEFLEAFMLKRVGPHVADFERIAVVREPMDMLSSYYKYLRRPAALEPGHVDFARNTQALDFDAFVQRVFSDQPNAHSNVSRPFGFIQDRKGAIGVDALFSFARLPDLAAHMSERCGATIELPVKNASPSLDVQALSPETQALVERKMERDFQLYRAIMDAPDGQPLRARGRCISNL